MDNPTRATFSHVSAVDSSTGMLPHQAMLSAIGGGALTLPEFTGDTLPAEREEALFSELYLLAPVGYFLLESDTTIVQANLVGADLLGITRANPERQRFRGFVAQRFLSDFDDFFARARAREADKPLRCPLQLQRSRGEQGFPVTLIGNASGDHLRITVEPAEGRLAALEKSEERFRRIVQTAREGIWELDAGARTTFVNPRMAQLLGYQIEEMLEQPLAQFMDSEGRALLERNLARRQQGMPERREFKFLRKDGAQLWVHMAANPIFDAHGGYLGALALVSDITEHREAVELAWQQANFDVLTGLPNRNMFRERLRHEMRKARREGGFLALLFIDLDQFKQINDSFGHQQGDVLLVEAARRIGACMRASDTLARIGGDEFVAILPGLAHVQDAERVAEDIITVLNRAFDLGSQQGLISGSVGIALYPSDAADAEELLRHADQAMYAAKNGGRNRYSYFTADMQAAAQQRLRLAAELRRAVARQEFELYYQPIVNLRTGTIERAEALLRWHHPERGILSPGDFIAGAESSGALLEIGHWAFRQAAVQVRQWQQELGRPFQISINQSSGQVRADNPEWHGYIESLALPPRSIVLDVSEDLLSEPDGEAVQQLRRLRAMGLQVALDDFGTGHSALAQLKQFDVDYLKIDSSFVAGLTGADGEDDGAGSRSGNGAGRGAGSGAGNGAGSGAGNSAANGTGSGTASGVGNATGSGDLALCEAIIVLAHKLGLEVVAEGVETEGQLALLRAAGCDYAQGYVYARPVPAPLLLELARAGTPVPAGGTGGVISA